MTLKKIYIRQPAGLGDILYLQKIAHYLSNNGYSVIWPVISNFEYISKYIQIPNISFISFSSLNEEEQNLFKINKDYTTKNYSYIPLNTICHYMNNCNRIMESKYEFFDIDHENWQNYVSITRNYERENKLKTFLNLKENEEFIFINKLFVSPPNTINVNFNINTSYKIIENKVEYLDMFEIFDFCWILENAKEIHTIDTSFCYLVECLKTVGDLYLYPRMINNNKQYKDYSYISNIYKKNWKYMEIQ